MKKIKAVAVGLFLISSIISVFTLISKDENLPLLAEEPYYFYREDTVCPDKKHESTSCRYPGLEQCEHVKCTQAN